MYEEQNMQDSAPFLMTWGIDNPLLNIGAYMGVSFGARALSRGVSVPRWIPGIGGAHIGSPMRSAMRQQVRGNIPAGSHRFIRDLERRHGAGRWMSRVRARDFYPGAYPSGTAYTRGPRRGLRGAIGRRVAERQLLMRGITDRLGPGMAARVAGYRALTGLLHITNISFAAYLGSQLLGAAGDMIANWRPAEPINHRRQLETGGPIIDTTAAFTMRSRAIQAIHNTQIGTRAALGLEAAFFHGDGA
jgi:hypothetical protein